MARAVPEWIGATESTPAPPRVRLRVFRAHNGICHRSGRKIMPGDVWQTDHIIAMIDGGKNCESNLAPILSEFHKEKTKEEVARKAKVDAVAKRHLGIKRAVKKIEIRGFARSERVANRKEKLPLPPRVQDIFGRAL